MNIVYHGSSNGNLETITAHKSTHRKECIYATPDETVAFLFMGKGKGDLDTMIATIDGKLTLVERRPGILNKLYNKGGYLYELDGSTFNHYDYLWSKEVISFEKSLKPLKKTYYHNILEEIDKHEQEGKIKVYRYPSRPENVPLNNSDLIDKYIMFERQGLTGAVNDLLEIYPEFASIVEQKLEVESNSKHKI